MPRLPPVWIHSASWGHWRHSWRSPLVCMHELQAACRNAQRGRAPDGRVLVPTGVEAVGVTCALHCHLVVKPVLWLQAEHAVFLKTCYWLTYKLAPLSTSSSWPAPGCLVMLLGTQEMAHGCLMGTKWRQMLGHLRVIARHRCVLLSFSSVHSPTPWPPHPLMYTL